MESNILIDFYNKINVNDYDIKYTGLIFIDNIKNGKESIKYFFEKYNKKWLEHLEDLSGNFLICIKDKISKKSYILTDNSGMYRVYYDEKYVSNSFLKYIQLLKKNTKDINYAGLVEIINFGFNIFETPIKGLKILNRDEIIILDKETIKIKPKKIKSIFSEGANIYDFYKNLKNNFSDKNIACDITAGTDSRMNAALLKHNNISFQSSIVGPNNHIDVKKCNEISKILNIDCIQCPLNNSFDNKLLNDIFESLDGQYSILEFYKNYILTQYLKDNKISLRISGAGGELYKYSWYAQDFPRLNSKRFSIQKVYKKRFLSSNLSNNNFSDGFQLQINEYKNFLIDILNKSKENTNTKTYDKFCYEYIMRFGASTQMININDDNYNRYCPLLELKVVRNGIKLSPYSRLTTNFNRKVITKSNKKVAKVLTNKGMTCTSNVYNIFKDFIKLFLVEIKRRANKKQNIDTANSIKIYQYYRKNCNRDLKMLCEMNILKQNVNLDEINDDLLSRLLTISFIIKKMLNEK